MRQVFKKVSVRQKIGVSTPRPPRLEWSVLTEIKANCPAGWQKIATRTVPPCELINN